MTEADLPLLRGVERGPDEGGLGMAWGASGDPARQVMVLPETRVEWLGCDVFQDVKDWHVVFDVPVLDSPQALPLDRYGLRRDLIEEESDELLQALADGDVAQVAKEGCDLIYVVAGLFAEMGIDGARVWAEVQRSNMSKAEPDGTVLRREDGKILKGSAYSEADVAGVLGL